MDVESADGASCDVLCWGCGLCLTLPAFSPNYKCGYCGALTLDDSRVSWCITWLISQSLLSI